MLDDIEKKIEEKRKELLQLKEIKKQFKENPCLQLAELLHAKLSCDNKEEYKWIIEKDWTSGEHHKYLVKAQNLIYDTKLDVLTLIKVIENL